MTNTSKALLHYESKWVALNIKKDKVLASASNVLALDKKLRSLKFKRDEVILTWVFPFNQSISPFNV